MAEEIVPPGQAWAKRDALTNLLTIGAVGLGGGLAAGGLRGLYDRLNRQAYDPLLHTSPVSTPLPVFAESPEEKERKRRAAVIRGAGAFKAAQVPASPAPPPVLPSTPPPTDSFQGYANMLPDFTTSHPDAAQWQLPAKILAGVVPFAGGFALMNQLSKRMHRGEVNTALQEAKQDFNTSLANEYRAAMRRKAAGDETPLGSAVSHLYAKPSPSANLSGALATANDVLLFPWKALLGENNVEQFKGLLNTIGLGAAAAGGYGAYQYTKSKTPEESLTKAIQLRARQRRNSPVAPYAVLAPEAVS